MGQVTLPVTFGTLENFRRENVTFDVTETLLPYNDTLRRPALAKFMAATHRAYNAMKIPAKGGVVTIRTDSRDAVFCMEQLYREAAAAIIGGSRDLSDSNPSPSWKKRLTEDRGLTKKVPLLEGGGWPSLLGPASLTNRKAHSSPSFGTTRMCSHGTRPVFLAYQGR